MASSSASRSPARLIRKPAVVFADEPTGNLDSTASAEVLGAAAARRRRVRSDDRDGHARRRCRRLRRPPGRPRRRADRARRACRGRCVGPRADEDGLAHEPPRLPGPARTRRPHRFHPARRRARRRADRRHVRPHRHDLEVLRQARRHRRRERRRQGPLAHSGDAGDGTTLADLPRLRRSARSARRGRRRRHRRRLPRAVGHGRRCPRPACGPTQGAPTLAFSAVPERFDTFDYTAALRARTARSRSPRRRRRTPA